jgi:hypothetical protein
MTTATCRECGGAFSYPPPAPGQFPPGRCEPCLRASRARRAVFAGAVASTTDRYAFIKSGNVTFLAHDLDLTVTVGDRVSFVADPADRPTFSGRHPVARHVELLPRLRPKESKE